MQPALKSDGWDTEPFDLVERDGKLFGRGSTDDKGPVLGWLHAINAYKAVGEEVIFVSNSNFDEEWYWDLFDINEYPQFGVLLT